MGKTEDEILAAMQKANKPLTLVEIAELVGKPPKKVFGPIRKLFEQGKIDCDNKNHTYQLAKQ